MQNSKIEWTDHTFNPWWGCQRVSPGCEHCYAETLAKRYGHNVWGPAKTTERRRMSDNYWKQPVKWNEAARQAGKRARVFCASMADVFEDHPEVRQWRDWLMTLISNTAWLDWLLLTKRPENVLRLAPFDWRYGFPPNVWIGTSVEDQRRADERIPVLLQIPARVRFLSCEPLLGPVVLRDAWRYPMFAKDDLRYQRPDGRGVDWVIVGGESGHGARPMHPDWARALRDQCTEVGVNFFFKQWGEYKPTPWPRTKAEAVGGKPGIVIDRAGNSVYAQVGHVLGFRAPDDALMERWGKHAAGRELDGRTWDEFPL
jgi:protein gp37